jgi:uncharacterized protein
MPRSIAMLAVLVLGALTAATRAAEPGCDIEQRARVLSVSGAGEVRAQPDRATVTLGILAREPTLAAARAGANRVMTALLALTRDLAIAAEQVHSTRVAVNPEYSWNEPRRERRLVGYVVQRQLIVELRDLERLGELLEKGLSAGANLVAEPVLDSSRRADLEREALARAAADARHNAVVLATALDASVGAPRSVATASAQRPLPLQRMALATAAPAEAPESYQSGELTFTATVTASFDLVPGPPSR